MKRVLWGLLLAALALLLLYLTPPLKRPPARAQRIQNVNRVWQVTFTMTNLDSANLDALPRGHTN